MSTYTHKTPVLILGSGAAGCTAATRSKTVSLTWSRIVAACAVFLLSWGTAATSLIAAEPGSSDWSMGEKARARLVSAVTDVGTLEVIRLGLEIELQDGWKTYWRSPGDAGLPPQIDWTGSTNLSATNIRYPAPKRFDFFGLETFGYKNRIIYPIDVTLNQISEPLALTAIVDILICDDVCIPHNMMLSLDLPNGTARPSAFANSIDRFDSLVPGDGSQAGLVLEGAALLGTSEAPILQAVFRAEQPFVAPDMLVEGPEFVVFGRPRVEFTPETNRVLMTVAAKDLFGEVHDLEVTSGPLTLTLIDGDRAMEVQVSPLFGGAPPFDVADFGSAGATTFASFLTILGLALVGGLILNLMPCVLPVLSIKFMAVAGHGGGDPRHVRIGFLATTAGIVGAFLALATVLVTLKSLGMAVGWGIQFQQPAFIVTLILILVLFAANMWGLFEVRLPGAVSDAAVSHSGGTTLRGHFFTGVFATILATPCSAPFLGTAVGFALSRGAAEIFAVFAALGLGMALPFLAVAAFPRVATMLPKPGAWMLILKKFMAMALIATALWLLTVLAVQTSSTVALIVSALMVAILLVMTARGLLPPSLIRAVPVAVIAIAVGAYAAPVVLPAVHTQPHVEVRGNVEWLPFDRMVIPELVASGKLVFVDVTAEWCITCQVNKRRVLDAGDVAQILESDDIIAMKADWTQPNEEIAAYLAGFNRFGIPFNVIYGPEAPAGVTLPELLTNAAVFSALARAGLNQAVVRNE